jgi:phosphatidylglycerophosphatase A
VTPPPTSSPGRTLRLAIAALGPCGYAPIVPATVASAVLATCYAVLPALGWGVDLAAAAATILIGVWAAELAEREWGHDARRIVIDEGAGMAVTLCGQPSGVTTALVAFLAFRAFDVLKPFPARRAEGLRGGLGVVADDVLAGVYANLAVRAVAWAMGRAGLGG